MVATDGSGDIYVGGPFTSYNGITINRIARLNSDGSLDTGFTPTGTGLNSSVQSLALATDGSGDIYVGGDFLSYAEQIYNFIVRLKTTGAID